MEEYLTLNKKGNSIEKDQVIQEGNQEINSKVYRWLKQLESSYNPDATRIFNDIEKGRNIILDQANIVLFSEARKFESTNFEQSWNHNDARIKKNGEWKLKKS
jgi:2-succinyl-5-enolpyruvyl-6-hydroxy-3-cyclohexene-1-carboxylate synthase